MLLPIILFSIISLIAGFLSLNRFLSLSRQPNIFFTVIIVIAIYIPISITFLLPIDILSSNESSSDSFFFVKTKYILFLWKFDYWFAFVLMWFILPYLQEYYRSGEFTRINKVKDSIKRNLKFQLIVGTVGIIGLVYYFLKFGFELQTFKSLLIALSHTYSLILSLWLMSHGLINIPKRRWLRNINLEKRLDHYYLELPKIYDDYSESVFNFKDISSTISAIEKIPRIDQSVYGDEVAILLKSLPLDLDYRNHIRSTEFTSVDQLSHSILSKLNSTLKREETNYRSSLYEFTKSKAKITRLQDITESKASRSLKFRFGNSINNGKLNYIVHVNIIPAFNLTFSIIQSILSIIIIQSELFHSTKLSIVNQILLSNLSSTLKFIISVILITYMSTSALISLTRIKIFKTYHLFPIHSSPVSVVFFTMYSNRLTIPLSFNFLTLLQSGRIHSQFNEFLGKSINLSVLGGFFNDNLPRLIIIPIALTLFNVFDKIKRRFSLEYLDFDDDEESGNGNKRESLIKEGKLIIQRELAQNDQRLYSNSNSELSSQVNLDSNGLEDTSISIPGLQYFKNWFKKDQSLRIPDAL